jgi:glycosyltransferase involved in cell wall biosynthesis
MARKKILHLITTLDGGGAQDNTFLTARKLPRDRFEVHLAGATGRWEARARECADKLFVLKHLRRDLAPLRDPLALVEISRILMENRYDLVHTHSSKAGFLGRLAATLCGVPAVLHTVHGWPFHDNTFSSIFRRLFLTFEGLASRWCNLLIFVSRRNLEEAVALRIAPKEKLRFIASGVEMGRFSETGERDEIKRGIGLDPRIPVIGAVGRVASSSGTDLFIKALMKLFETHPRVQALIVGDGPMREEWARLSGGDRRFFWTGWRDDVPRVLGAVDIFVFPIRWGGVGRALTEAMAAAVPVVACDVDGVSEAVRDGETGFLVPLESEEALVAKMIYLLENREAGERLGQRGRAVVEELFSSGRMLREIESVYEEALREEG